ncbi:beta-1,3-galactosyltransferase 1 isoform X1 [Anabrus simplex]|uniref:beta-1,3-galactosyltransferase 1 isoform X1 n=2 Tax=Anabrus simplex TaxID=316456 RepID=UPI0035A36C57
MVIRASLTQHEFGDISSHGGRTMTVPVLQIVRLQDQSRKKPCPGLMAFRVRKYHSVLLGFVGLSLVAYSSFYSTPGLLYLQDAVTDLELASDSYSLLEANDEFEPEQNSQSPADGLDDFQNGDESDIVNLPLVKTPSTVTSAKEKSGPTTQVLRDNNPNAIISTSSSQVVDVTVPENTTSNTSVHHVTVEHAALPAPNNGTADSAGKAILTRSIYESSFDVPNPELCPNMGRNIQVMVIVTSAPTHKDARMAIRYTWGHYSHRKDVSIAFLLGSVQDAPRRKALDAEGDLYHDLIRSRFLDTYNNLTLKSISMLEWVDKYCNLAKYVLKTDDDMFINVPRLLAFIDKKSKEKKTIFGRLAKKWKPIRNKASKYYVSLDQYRPPLFPDFTTGPAYLLTSDVVHDMYVAALNKTYLKLEDVFLTGIVAQELKIKRLHVNEFFNKRTALSACNIQKGVSIHMIKYHEQFDLWKKLLDGKTKCN